MSGLAMPDNEFIDLRFNEPVPGKIIYIILKTVAEKATFVNSANFTQTPLRRLPVGIVQTRCSIRWIQESTYTNICSAATWLKLQLPS